MSIKCMLLSVLLLTCTIMNAQEEDKREIELGVELTSELQATQGGKYNNVNLLRLNTSLPINDNITLEAASLSTCMTASDGIGEDLQAFSNIEAGNITFALSVFGAGWQIDYHHYIFAGIRNMNEDYFTSPVTSFFTNSSCGIYPTIAANSPIANYPVASVGVHYKYETEVPSTANTSNHFAFQASLYNGTAYNRFTGHEKVLRFRPKDDGVFGITQVEYHHNGNSYFLGNSLYYNRNMETKMSDTPWFYTEQRICDRITLLAGYSHAFCDEADCQDFAGLGAHYDIGKYTLGVFTDYARFTDCDEWATEVSGKYTVSKYIDLQPSAHFIKTGTKWNCYYSFRLSIGL